LPWIAELEMILEGPLPLVPQHAHEADFDDVAGNEDEGVEEYGC
jgi:hypothetical protein